MIIKQCIMTNSRCYKETGEDPKTGIIVHCLGANQTYLKRFVQPSDDDPAYGTIIEDLGKNLNKNDWNHTNVVKGVHAFIGRNKAGVVEVYQVLPYEKNAWGVAAGKYGSVNYGENARIQFEVCQDFQTPGSRPKQAYFDLAIPMAIEYCAELCHEFGWDETKIWSHKEAIANGWGTGPRVDIDYWLEFFGKDMNWFRDEVHKRLHPEEAQEELKVGDKVMLRKDATIWGKKKKFSSWVYTSVLYVLKIKGDRVWFSINPSGPTTGTTDKKYIIKI